MKKKIQSLYDVIQEEKRQNNTLQNKHSDFKVGDRVKVVVSCQDMYFFDPKTQNLNGTVVRNSGSHIGIIVKWDEPRHYESHVQHEFNFEPTDLVLLKEAAKADTSEERDRKCELFNKWWEINWDKEHGAGLYRAIARDAYFAALSHASKARVPVVKLPERQEEYNDPSTNSLTPDGFFNEGFNLCIDEFLRLNPWMGEK